MSNISYVYFDGSEKTEESVTSEPSKIRSHFETINHGRCFTFSPTKNMIQKGIKEVTIGIHNVHWRRSALNSAGVFVVYFHNKGMFKKEAHDHITMITAQKNKSTHWDLEFRIYEMLDFVGQRCETEPGFDLDDCTETRFEKKSLEKFGCTLPFAPNKDKICQGYENSSKVMDMYKEEEKKVDKCYSPCSFLLTKAIKTIEHYDNNPKVIINFQKYIQVIEAYHLYSALSMIAEVGGYVGLFLGISVNQVSGLVNFVLDRFDWVCNRKKRLN